MERTRRSGQSTCLIMCDLDHSKMVKVVLVLGLQEQLELLVTH